jgi:hypothetical protein
VSIVRGYIARLVAGTLQKVPFPEKEIASIIKFSAQETRYWIGDAGRRTRRRTQVRLGGLEWESHSGRLEYQKLMWDPPFPLGKGHPELPLPSGGVGRPQERWDETVVSVGPGKNRDPIRFAVRHGYARRAEAVLHKPRKRGRRSIRGYAP